MKLGLVKGRHEMPVEEYIFEEEVNLLETKQIVEALQNNNSLEFEYGEKYYYLHLKENGEIVPDYSLADNSFRVKIDIPKELEDTWFDLENANNSSFMEAVEELKLKANNWLKEVK